MAKVAGPRPSGRALAGKKGGEQTLKRQVPRSSARLDAKEGRRSLTQAKMIDDSRQSKAHSLSRRRLASLLQTSEDAVARFTDVRLHKDGWVSFRATGPDEPLRLIRSPARRMSDRTRRPAGSRIDHKELNYAILLSRLRRAGLRRFQGGVRLDGVCWTW